METLYLVIALYIAFLLVFSLFSYLAIKSDKILAEEGEPRIAEWKLHALELFGGVLGSYAAQRVHRHKLYKTTYQMKFWFIVGMHSGLIFTAFYYREAINYLRFPCIAAGHSVA